VGLKFSPQAVSALLPFPPIMPLSRSLVLRANNNVVLLPMLKATHVINAVVLEATPCPIALG
jgi:hypothetical protein